MVQLKTGLRFFIRILLWFIGFIILYLLVIFIVSRITVNATDSDTAQDVVIYIKTNGVHTDIVVPVKNSIKDWSDEVKPELATVNDKQFVGFGWGDKGFYLNTPQWSDLKVSTACYAAFYLGSSAMHATFFDQIKEGPKCVKLTISKQEYEKLATYIASDFQFDKNHNTILIADAAYGDHDSFYEAKGRYSFLYTCNSWANAALKASGQKAALWTLTDTGIFCHYD